MVRGDRAPGGTNPDPAGGPPRPARSVAFDAIAERGLRAVTVSELVSAPDEPCSSDVADARVAAY